MQFLALAAYIAGASALGINCRGSGMCILGTPPLQNIQNQLGDLISRGNGDKFYHAQDQIVCADGLWASTCAYFQKGANGTAQDAYNHVQNLLDHGCSTCGSDPTQDGNDVSTGELTVNAVSEPCCDQDCAC